MTDTVFFIAALFAVAIAIMAGLYGLLRNARSRPERDSYRRHRPWNFK